MAGGPTDNDPGCRRAVGGLSVGCRRLSVGCRWLTSKHVGRGGCTEGQKHVFCCSIHQKLGVHRSGSRRPTDNPPTGLRQPTDNPLTSRVIVGGPPSHRQWASGPSSVGARAIVSGLPGHRQWAPGPWSVGLWAVARGGGNRCQSWPESLSQNAEAGSLEWSLEGGGEDL